MKNEMKRIICVAGMVLALAAPAARAQDTAMVARTLSLDDCRQMAIISNKNLEQQRAKLEMAGYDRKIAAANYFPKISAIGTYQHTWGDFSLVDDRNIPQFGPEAAKLQSAYNERIDALTQLVSSNPLIAAAVAADPKVVELLGNLTAVETNSAIAGVGQKVDQAIDETIHPDISDIYLGVVSIQQPLFVGGKIIASNRMAKYAEELARYEYDGNYDAILIDVDQAYWQVVSVANKKKLAESYSELLHKMKDNVEVSVKEGVATEADALTVRVKCNEADMTLTKATNGLVLAKMLLCKQIGLPLDSDVRLLDEELEMVPLPDDEPEKSMEEILAARSETKRLDLARKIYHEKTNVARADMLPTVALTGNYLVMNPNMNHGFQNEFGQHWAAGVMVSVPVFHGTEALQKTRKAKAEERIYQNRYDDACEMIEMQVTQLRQQRKEALQRLEMAENNLASADENLRIATLGQEAGVVDVNTALGAQTAWLKAHSECIDAGIELQLNNSRLKAALGNYTSDIELAKE